MSRRQDAIAELLRRCQRITTANGFQTEVGASVLLGETPVFGPDDPDDSLALEVQEDEPGYQGEDVAVVVPVLCQAIVKAGSANPWPKVEAIIADVKKAVEIDHDLTAPSTGKPTLVRRGLTRGSVVPLDREGGSEFVGAAVTYRLLMKEKWGDP